MDESNKLNRIPFTERESEIIMSLSKWMMIFVLFYICVGLIYFGLSINFFINGFGNWGLEPKELFSVILFIIGFIAIWLAKDLSASNKFLRLVVKNGDADKENLGKIFRKLRNYFFTGAILTIFVIILLMFGMAFVFLREF